MQNLAPKGRLYDPSRYIRSQRSRHFEIAFGRCRCQPVQRCLGPTGTHTGGSARACGAPGADVPLHATASVSSISIFAVRTALLFWALIALLAYQPRMLETVAKWYGVREKTALALLVGARDEELIFFTEPYPVRFLEYADQLRARHKSV